MTKRHRFLDWLEVKLQGGIDYCQDRSLYRIPKGETEEVEEDDES